MSAGWECHFLLREGFDFVPDDIDTSRSLHKPRLIEETGALPRTSHPMRSTLTRPLCMRPLIAGVPSSVYWSSFLYLACPSSLSDQVRKGIK